MEEKAKQVVELLKILSNENRLLILCALQNGKMNVGEITSHVQGITKPALSQHLTLLKTAGILESDKQGMNIVYSIGQTPQNFNKKLQRETVTLDELKAIADVLGVKFV